MQQQGSGSVLGSQSQDPMQRSRAGADDSLDNGAKASMEARRQKFLAEDRQRRMAADAEKLVKLANEIKDEVNKTTKDELSVTVVKKTAEMEKLARDIRSRMTN